MPTTGIQVSVTKSEAAEARYTAVPTTSSGVPQRPAGVRRRHVIILPRFFADNRAAVQSVSDSGKALRDAKRLTSCAAKEVVHVLVVFIAAINKPTCPACFLALGAQKTRQACPSDVHAWLP